MAGFLVKRMLGALFLAACVTLPVTQPCQAVWAAPQHKAPDSAAIQAPSNGTGSILAAKPKPDAKNKNKSNAQPITLKDMQKAEICVPSLGNDADDTVVLKDGEYKSEDMPFVKIRAYASGTLDGKPAGVAEMTWNTGGSGNWSTIILFRRRAGGSDKTLDGFGKSDVASDTGKVYGDYTYSPGTSLPKGGTVVTRIAIKNNRVYLYGEAPMENRKISTPLIIKSSAFKRCQPLETNM